MTEQPYVYDALDVEPLHERAYDNGRVIRFGRLKTPVPGHEDETHVLYLKTPVQEVTFLLCYTDAALFGMVSFELNGRMHINERFLRRALGEKGDD